MNPFADEEARFAQALHVLREAAKKNGQNDLHQVDLQSNLTAAEAKLADLEAELAARDVEIAGLKQRLHEQASIIDDVDAVIDGLRAQLGDG
ncbi:MAG: hypothetical protein AAGA63_07555 [Pseudomonadota bacterium]